MQFSHNLRALFPGADLLSDEGLTSAFTFDIERVRYIALRFRVSALRATSTSYRDVFSEHIRKRHISWMIFLAFFNTAKSKIEGNGARVAHLNLIVIKRS